MKLILRTRWCLHLEADNRTNCLRRSCVVRPLLCSTTQNEHPGNDLMHSGVVTTSLQASLSYGVTAMGTRVTGCIGGDSHHAALRNS